MLCCVVGCGEVVSSNGGGDGGAMSDGALNTDASIPPGACDGPQLAIENFAKCFLQKSCEKFVKCGFGPGNFRYASVDECVAQTESVLAVSGELSQGQAESAVGAGVIDYDPVQGYLCVASFNQPSCRAPTDEVACASAAPGRKSQGEGCVDNLECGIGGRCIERANTNCTDACCEGTCVDPSGVNSPCGSQREFCAPGLQCVRISANANLCSQGDTGDFCSADAHCRFENHCGDGLGDDEVGRCAADLSSGEACSRTSMCQGNLTCVDRECRPGDAVGLPCNESCFGTLYCDANSGSCLELPASEDEVCGSAPTCLGVDLACSTNTERACTPRKAAGESCVLADDTCAAGLACRDLRDGTGPRCEKQLRAVGMLCSADGECETLNCDSQSRLCAARESCYE